MFFGFISLFHTNCFHSAWQSFISENINEQDKWEQNKFLVGIKSVWVADGQIIIALNLWKNLAERVKIYIIWTFIFLKKLAWARQQFFHRQKISLVKTGFPSGKIGASGRLIFLENSRRNSVHQKTWHKQFFWNQQTLVFFTRLGSRSQKSGFEFKIKF